MTCSRSTWSVPDQLQTASTATHRVVEPTSTAERYDRLKRCPATVPAAAAATAAAEYVTTTTTTQQLNYTLAQNEPSSQRKLQSSVLNL